MSDNIVTIPVDLIINCPQKKHKLTHVVGCVQCPSFQGVMDVKPDNDKLAWENKYHVICAHPQTRHTMRVY